MSEEIFNLQKLTLDCDSDKYLNIGKNINESDQGKAFSFLSLGLSLDSSKKDEYYDLYFNVLERWNSKLLENLRYQDALKLFEVAQEIYPNSPDFNFLLAGVLFRLGKTREAWEYSLKVFRNRRYDPKVRGLVAAITNELVDRWHIPMINDGTRNNVFKLAIKKCIMDGHTSVLDIGCGSGLLSVFASREGGRLVYACEVDDFMCEMAGNVLALNDVDVHLLNCHSTNIGTQIPSRVSLVISETFDAGLFGENILRTLDHAWDELLLPPKGISPSNLSTDTEREIYGQVIPNSADIYLALIECDTIRRQTKANVNFQNGKCVQVKLDMTEPYLSEKMEVVPGNYTLLSSWKSVLSINFNSPSAIKNILNNGVKKDINFEVETEGRLDGLILAFKLHLDEEHSIQTFPDSNTCWENAIFPFNLNNFCKVRDLVKFQMSFDDVLKFILIEPEVEGGTIKESHEGSPTVPLSNVPSYSTFKTTDPQMLKCMNSKSFRSFFRLEAHKLSNYFKNTPLNILDTCDFPEGGITFLELSSDSKLFVTNQNAFELISQAGISIYPSSAIPQKVDVVIFWPFTNEGTLIDNFLEELTRLRNLLADGGRIIPECLEIQTIGLESSRIDNMTRINDRNTCDVEIEEVFNLVMTHHHLDIPLEEISYKPMTSVIIPVRLSLNDPDTMFQDFLEIPTNSLESLTVGNKSVKKIIQCAAPSTGNIVGFAYWFEMSGAQEQGSTSCSEVENGENISFMTSGEALSPQSLVEEESSISTFSSDSPVNQCILLLDDIRPVAENEILEVHFTMCEGLFSIRIAS